MVNRDFITQYAKKIVERFPESTVRDTQANNLKPGDFHIQLKSIDRDNKLHNNSIQRFFQDTSVRVIYYYGDQADTKKVNEVQDFLLDMMQWVELDGRITRARDCQITYGDECIICVAKYYNMLVKKPSVDTVPMTDKIDSNTIERS